MTYQPRIIENDLEINVPSDYDTVQNALESIADYLIAGSVTVTINVEEGGYTQSSDEVWYHKNADRIKIVGSAATLTTNSFDGSSGYAGSWSMTYSYIPSVPVSTADQNLYCLFRSTAVMEPSSFHHGCWKISNVDTGSTQITLVNTSGTSSVPSWTGTGTLEILRSQVTGTVNILSSFRAIKNIMFYSASDIPCIVGETPTDDFVIGEVFINKEIQRNDISVFMKNCGFRSAANTAFVSDFSRVCLVGCSASIPLGFAVPAAILQVSKAVINDCSFVSASQAGLYLSSSFVTAIKCVFDGSSVGILSYNEGANSIGFVRDSYVCYNTGNGIYTESVHCSMNDTTISDNASVGIYGADMSYFNLYACTVEDNNSTSYDITMTASSYCISENTTYSGSTFSPSHDTVANYNSYIYVS